MVLDPKYISRLAERAAVLVDDHYRIPNGRLEQWDSYWMPDISLERLGNDAETALFGRISKILERYPHLAEKLGYSWATDRRSYRSPMDVVYQLIVLESIAELDTDHPHIREDKPVVARMAINRDFISRGVPGDDVDFIFIARGFMDFLKYFVELVVSLEELGNDDNSRTLWGIGDLDSTSGRHPELVNDFLQRFMIQSVRVVSGKFPHGGKPIGSTLFSKWASKPILAGTYMAVESFIIAHELGHLLGRHSLADNSREKEIQADRAALSLSMTRSGIEGSEVLSVHAIYLGSTLFYELGELYFQISMVLDESRGDPRLDYYVWVFAELRARRLACREHLHGFGLDLSLACTLAREVHEVTALCRLFLSALAKNLRSPLCVDLLTSKRLDVNFSQQCTELRRLYSQTKPDLESIAKIHGDLADYYYIVHADPAKQRAHRLAAAVVYQIAAMGRDPGTVPELADTIVILADELRSDFDSRHQAFTIGEVVRLLGQIDGNNFRALIDGLASSSCHYDGETILAGTYLTASAHSKHYVSWPH